MTVTHDVETLTPEDARRLLDHNTHNRPLRDGDIMRWATEMEAGRWRLNGEAIKVAKDGRILDGQHRLHALALQDDGMTIRTLVVRGLEDDTQMTMDQGRKRSPSDQLTLAGVPVSSTVTSGLRFYLIYKRGLLFRDSKRVAAELSTSSIVQWALANEDTVELARRGDRFKKIKARPGVIVGAYVILSEIHTVEVADEFFSRTMDGVGLELGSPILALRNRLDSLNGQLDRKSKQKISDRDLLATTFVAFNAWVSGRPLGRIQRPDGASWTADNFPKIRAPKRVR